MSYTITRNNNDFTITKTGVNLIYITLYKEEFCSSNTWVVVKPEQTVTTNLVVTLPTKDDIYKITITDKQLLIVNKIIYHYQNLLVDLISYITEVLCGCKCDDCEDCEEIKYDTVLSKLKSYNIINSGIYYDNLKLTNNCIRCNVLYINVCNLLTEQTTGVSDNKLLIKQLIAYYYLVYYYTDIKISSVNNDSIDYKKIYNFNTISKCIKKLNINTNCIKQLIYPNITSGIFTSQFTNTFN